MSKQLRITLLILCVVVIVTVFWLDDPSHMEDADTWASPMHTVPGKVIGVAYIPAATVYRKLYKPGPRSWYPPSLFDNDIWLVRVAYAGTEGEWEVSQGFYQHVRGGSDVNVSYATGWMTGRMYVKAVALLNGH